MAEIGQTVGENICKSGWVARGHQRAPHGARRQPCMAAACFLKRRRLASYCAGKNPSKIGSAPRVPTASNPRPHPTHAHARPPELATILILYTRLFPFKGKPTPFYNRTIAPRIPKKNSPNQFIFILPLFS